MYTLLRYIKLNCYPIVTYETWATKIQVVFLQSFQHLLKPACRNVHSGLAVLEFVSHKLNVPLVSSTRLFLLVKVRREVLSLISS